MITRGDVARAAFRVAEAGVPAPAPKVLDAGSGLYMYYTYILRSEKDGNYYYGSTNDINRRLREHNSGKVLSTKSRTPFTLHYVEKYPTLRVARARELFFKKRSGYKWLKLREII